MSPLKQIQLLVLLSVVVAGGSSGQAASPTALPAAAVADTVRSNLWLTEALMGEVVTAVAAVLPPAPAAVRLVPMSNDKRNDVFQAVAAGALGKAGYHLYIAADDTAGRTPVDCVFEFGVQKIALSYPEVGRTLGVWRRWVERNLQVSVLVEISEEDSGRILLNQRVERGFSDHVTNDAFDQIDSAEYDFTTAETSESGWHSRLEEIVVLGTLTGLVAIYFANTGN